MHRKRAMNTTMSNKINTETQKTNEERKRKEEKLLFRFGLLAHLEFSAHPDSITYKLRAN